MRVRISLQIQLRRADEHRTAGHDRSAVLTNGLPHKLSHQLFVVPSETSSHANRLSGGIILLPLCSALLSACRIPLLVE